MFLSESQANVYAMLYRHKVHRLKTQMKSSKDKNEEKKAKKERKHPLMQGVKYIAEVAFFGDGSATDEVFPEEL